MNKAFHNILFFSLCNIGSLSVLHAQVTSPIEIQETEQELFLDITLNQSPQKDLGIFLQKGQKLYISQETLHNLAIEVPDELSTQSFIDLNQLKALHYQFDSLNQKISLDVPLAYLNRINIYQTWDNSKSIKINPLQQRTGAVLNYNMFAQRAEQDFSLNGWNELRVFGLYDGVLSLSGNYSFQDDEFKNQHLLESYWERDDPDKLYSLRLGDVTTQPLSWSRPTRFSGISLSKNLSLQPYKLTTPLMSFKGEVALPSQVELLVNGIQQASKNVEPGQFDLVASPSLTGAGQAQLVMTDINGKQQLMSFPIYRSNDLLAKGLNDWAIHFGVAKLNYGLSSFDYADDPAFIGSYRQGLSNRLTLESHTELSNELLNAGVGTIYQLGQQAGVINASYAYSHTPKDNGGLLGLGYRWSSSIFNFNYNKQKQFGNFKDIASLNDAEYLKNSDQIFLGLNTSIGQFGASYVQLDYLNRESNELMILNWSKLISKRINFNLSYSKDLNRKDDSIYLSLYIPWSNKNSASVNIQNDRDKTRFGTQFRNSFDQDQGGFGWQLAADKTEDYANVQGQLGYLGKYGQAQLNLQNTQYDKRNMTIANASVDGGIVLFNNTLLPMRSSQDSFAIVSTNGIADVPVRLENRYIGKSNKDGYLLLNRLNAYQNNQISIDTLDLPIDVKIEKTQINAVPRHASAAFVEFPLKHVKSITLRAVDVKGNVLNVGENVWQSLDDMRAAKDPSTVVAHDGLIYIDDLATDTLWIGSKRKFCKIDLTQISGNTNLQNLGEIICQ